MTTPFGVKLVKFFQNTRFYPLISAFLGGFCALAFAPFLFWPALFSLSGLLFFLQKAHTIREAAKISFAFAFVFYFSSLYWVGNAFVTVGLGPVSLVAYLGLPLLLTLDLVTCGTLAWKFARDRSPMMMAFFFASAMAITTLLQADGELAFPWVEFGYAMPFTILQAASLIGVQGLGVLAVFAALIPFVNNKAYTAFFGMLFIGFYGFGTLQLEEKSQETPYNLRLIQPSISQENKWNPDEIQKNLQLQGVLSQMDAEKPIQAVLWPEAAVTFDYRQYPEVQKNLANAAPQGGYVFLGNIRKNEGRVFNSFSVLSDAGDIQAIYDKKHLVPFGEFVPFKHLLPGVEKLTHGSQDFSKGTEPLTISLKNLPPFRILICYEVLFANEILPKGEKRPEWILNVTNDAWYGNTTGPHQHLYITRARAIEQGLPVIRVANNGISAVIDEKGRIIHQLGLNDVGFIDFALPGSNPPTPYNRYGYFVSYALLILSCMILGGIIWLNRRKMNRQR